jgi:hypothetical protein
MIVLYYLSTFIPLFILGITVKTHSSYFAWMYVLSIIVMVSAASMNSKIEAFSKKTRPWPTLSAILGWSTMGSVLIGWLTNWPAPSQTVSLALIATVIVYRLLQGFVLLARAA